MTRTISRAAGAALAAAALAAALTSCAGVRAAGAADPITSSAVVDPSTAQSSAASVAPSASATGDAPTPTPTPTNAASTRPVVPFVTSATASGGTITVTALVPGVVERGGTCTATATKDGRTLKAAAGAVPASSYTGCDPIDITGAGAGTWSVQVDYVSAASSGSSKTRSVEVG